MCSRECYSVFSGRLLVGALVFLAAFLLGIGAARLFIDARFISKGLSTKSTLAGCPDGKHFPSTNEQVNKISLTRSTQATNDPETFVSTLAITNTGSETIYFKMPDLKISKSAPSFGEIKPPSLSTGYGVTILGPSESFVYSSSNLDGPIWIDLSYRTDTGGGGFGGVFMDTPGTTCQ